MSRTLRHSIDLVQNLVHRDFSLSYRRSVLGMLWSLLLPLAQLLVLVVVFQRLVPLGIARYPVFVFSALLPWTWFSACLTSACSLFIANRDLIMRPEIRPAVLVLVNVVSTFVTYLLALPVLLVMMVLDGHSPWPGILYFPLLAGIEGVLIVGLGLIVATLNVYYRDVQYVVGVAVMLLFYLTPVFYEPPTTLAGIQRLYELNPMAGLIRGYRAIFFYGTTPDVRALGVAAGVSIVVALVAYLAHRRVEHELIDVM